MDSFEFDVKKGLYKVNDDLIIRKIEINKYLVYLIDYKTKSFYRYEVIKDFELDANNEIYLYEYLLFLALSTDYTELHFPNVEELKDYIKVNILNEFTEDDFCDKPKNLKMYQIMNKYMTFIKNNFYDVMKFICVISIISIFNYFINNKAIFMLNSIYGESMKPTLKTYSAGIVVYPYQLSYGDLVACRKEVDGTKMNVLKRIIAVPGDHVEIINDFVYVNGIIIDEFYLNPAYRTTIDQTISFEAIWKKTRIYDTSDDYINKLPVVIPANYYFVLGDNRKDSYDSRNFGLVYFDEIVGEYIFTLLTI
ncbi:MAG: lepB [Haloplasmataceae bacterium]|nr:lepB [Haloplasmataceae bacterium]